MSTPKEREVDILTSLILNRYGDRLSDAEKAEVRKNVEGNVEAAEKLRSVPLENGDEPFSVFTPWRREK
jgi:hypothetical protein